MVASLFTMDDALLESGARVVSRAASAARKLAAEIVPMWKNDSAANTMEFTSALKAVMIEGYGPVTGLMDGVYSGKVDETEDGFVHYQLLKLGSGSDDEGPHEVESEADWGADPVAAFEQSRMHDVKAKVPSALEMKAHRAMVKKFGRLISKIVWHATKQENRHALSDMMDSEINPFPKWRCGGLSSNAHLGPFFALVHQK